MLELDNKEADLTCYPNPTTGRVHFSTDNLITGFTVELLDGVGNQIFSCEELSIYFIKPLEQWDLLCKSVLK